MTHFDKDKTMRISRMLGAVRLFVITTFLIGATAASATATAQVTLENSVQKVETFVNEAGEPQRRLVDADSVVPGDELRYTITFSNDGGETVDAGSVVITNPIPDETEYLDGTAFGSGTDIVYSVDGESFAAPDALTTVREGVEAPAMAKDYQSIRWVFRPALEPGETGNVSFSVRLK
ncbi:MAG: hypothetical protein OES38_14540 [Gammaproteobacteria bacterium]|nr:hypothetical protein [Gammaproteobacteria bacterium]